MGGSKKKPDEKTKAKAANTKNKTDDKSPEAGSGRLAGRSLVALAPLLPLAALAARGWLGDNSAAAAEIGARCAAEGGDGCTNGPQGRPGYGAGCQPLTDPNSWLAARLDMSALGAQARAFVCYDGRASAALGGEELEFLQKTGFSDTGVVLIEDFMVPAEVAHMLALGERHARETPQAGYRFAYGSGAQYGTGEEALQGADPSRTVQLDGDAVLNALEARIAAFTRVPMSNEESQLQLAVDEAPPASQQKTLPNFHHDKNHGLVRHVTSLIYLSETEDGGETIFPALPFHPQGPVPRTAELLNIAVAFAKIVVSSLKGLKPNSAWPAVQVPEGSSLNKQLAALCPSTPGSDQTDPNSTRPLAVRPSPGRAIFFWHESPEEGGEVLLDPFHAGCSVRKGKKVALQKFKNFPSGHEGCKGSKWCRHFF